MAITAADLKTRFPADFGGVDDEVIDQAIASIECMIGSKAWGTKADEGRLWGAAHLVKFTADAQAGAGSPGPIQSKSVNDVSVSFMVGPAFANSALGSTSYGRWFLQLRRTIFACRCT